MKQFIFLLGLFSAQLVFGQDDLMSLLDKHNDHSVSYISAEMLNQFQKNGQSYVILDSRELNEYNTSHIPDAIYVGYQDFDIQQITTLQIDYNTPIVVYCTIGVRSENIGEQLQELGYTNVQNLFGGIISWKNNELPVVDNNQNSTDLVHVYGKKWQQWLTNGTPVYD